MASYTSTGSYLSSLDNESSSRSTGRGRSNSLFDNPTENLSSAGSARSNSLLENTSTLDSSTTITDKHSHTPFSSPATHHRRTSSTHNSVVQAMITSNNLRNCREVEEMVFQCMNNKDRESSFMCKTAERYIGRCQK